MRITDIARMAGVSVASVSRYFNQGQLSEETRERIAEVVRQTGYNPSSQAVRLRKQETRLVALITPRIHHQPVAAVIEGISVVLEKNGYQIILANSGNDAKKELEFLQKYQSKNVDGVIFICGNFITPMHHKWLRSMRLPVVVAGQQVEGFACVFQPDRQAAADIGQLFRRKGIRHPVMISVNEAIKPFGIDRRDGFWEGYGRTEDGQNIPCVISSRMEPSAAYSAMFEVFAKYPDTDAIFCVADILVLGVYQYCEDYLIRIPEDISVAAVGGGLVTQGLRPKLTYAGLYHYKSGMVAAGQLLQILQDKTTEVESVQMDYELALNESIKNTVG
ncbi:MAG: LacI family DNA-binding transcriptional regulator [Lachnospiraceae bacterium]|nr:LacI family DNA-binding transcriptional regulator [Lachnospiraceae bacterium]MDY5742267.1 LacI family DNA-binding transcriptional regulator [Lachnospiraceae bacterium]